MLSVVEMMSSESTEVFDPSCRIPLPYVKVRYADLTQGVEIALGLPEDVERYVVSHQSDDLRRVFFKVSDDDATHPWLDVYLSVPGGYTSLPEAILSVRPKPSWCAEAIFYQLLDGRLRGSERCSGGAVATALCRYAPEKFKVLKEHFQFIATWVEEGERL